MILGALGLSQYFYINWYLKSTSSLQEFVSRFKVNPESFSTPGSWTFILISSLTLLIVITGLAIIVIYHQKTLQLYRQQENFISNFTHELKTPIASIKLYLDTFAKHELKPQEQKDFIQYMQKDAERLSKNVHQILLLAQIENKKHRYTFEQTNLYQYFKKFVQENSYLFSNGEVNIFKPKQDYSLELNLQLFDMVVLNILTNAFHYNDRRPEVSVSLSFKNGYLSIHFKDNGIGIQTADQKNIFKKFFKVKQKEGFTSKSSGLGLYLSRQIVKIHKGKIHALSEGTGKGCEIILSFPQVSSYFQRKLKPLEATHA